MWPVHMLLHARSVRTSFLHMWRVHILFYTYSHSGRARYLGIRALRSRSMWPMHFLLHPRSVCTSLLCMWPVHILSRTYRSFWLVCYLGSLSSHSRSMWPVHILLHARIICTSLLRMWPVQKYAWKMHMFKMGLSAFSGYQGGASASAGCTQEAMTDAFKHNNKA